MMVELRYTAVAHTTVFGPHWFPYLLTGMWKDYKGTVPKTEKLNIFSKYNYEKNYFLKRITPRFPKE